LKFESFGGENQMPIDKRLHEHFSSGFTGLNKPAKTQVEKITFLRSGLPLPKKQYHLQMPKSRQVEKVS
jgi:hypothetical protein